MEFKTKVTASIIAVVAALWLFPKFLGKAQEMRAQQFSESDANPSGEERQTFLVMHTKLCSAADLCFEATRGGDADSIVSQCSTAQTLLERIQVPKASSPAIERANQIYLQSSIHTNQNLLMAWKSVRDRTKQGLLKKLGNWEIETCARDSVPQRLYQAYHVTPAQGEIVMCDDLQKSLSREASAQIAR